MNDRPSAEELLGAVERFLREEAVPGLEGPSRFQARVAANVVAIVGRELARGETDLRAEAERLAALLGSGDRAAGDAAPRDAAALRRAVRAANEELCRRIRAGQADAGPFRGAVLDHLKRTVDEKLAVSLPPARRGNEE